MMFFCGPARLLSFVLALSFGQAFLWASCAGAQTLVPLTTPVRLPQVVMALPQGENTTLDALLKKGGADHYYLVHLWSPACRACVAEMKQLEKIHKALDRQGFTLLSVAQDPNGNFTVPAFSQRHEIESLPSYVDKEAALLRTLRPAGLPTTYLATPDGWIIAYHEGAMDWATMGSFVR